MAMGQKSKVFAYGSNMSTARMRDPDRAPSARVLGRARLHNMTLKCNKRSVDGSGKANVVFSPGGVVWGVVFEVDREDLARLDRAEGGYRREGYLVLTEHNEVTMVECYRSHKLTDDLRPFEWYKKMLVDGALEHGLPPEYVAQLGEMPCSQG